MPEQVFQAGMVRILYDPDRIDVVSPEWLRPAFWRQRRAVLAEFAGRGKALAVDSSAGPAVLRRYLRGGLIARVISDRYFFTGYDRSRSFREWRLLARLSRLGLPVPRPLVASCERLGTSYRAALMTRLIGPAMSLTETGDSLDRTSWRRLGLTLSEFFKAGVVHADLNASNLLIDDQGQWHVIDFDRGRLGSGPANPAPMLRRLFRSLDKHGIEGCRDLLVQSVGL